MKSQELKLKKITIPTILLILLTFNANAVPLIFDRFEYIVNNNTPSDCSRFLENGWSQFKTDNCAPNKEPGRYYGNGNIFTTNTITGFNGAFPSGGTRVLAIEALPVTYQGQTDFYLQFGSNTAYDAFIPARHWVQFWIYSENTPEHPSLFTPQSKFLYYNRDINYPATLNNNGFVFMTSLNQYSSAPNHYDPCPEEFTCNRGFFSTTWESNPNIADGLQHGNVDNNIEYEESHLGANLNSAAHVLPNQWTLVKMYVDFTGTDSRAVPGQAVYEQWIKRQGDTNWIKTTEFIGGVTISNGAPITFIPRFTDGFSVVRIPTTIGSSTYPQDTRDNTRNYWIYLDDFIMTATESDLPTYGATTPPQNPDTTAPSQVTGLSATSISSSQINLQWNSATDNVAIIGYQIFRNNALITTTNSTIYSNTGLAANTTYQFKIRAYDASGNYGLNSTTVSATTNPAITSPPINNTQQHQTAGTVYLSDLNWTNEGTPAIRDLNFNNGILTIASNTYIKGIGTHSPNNMTFLIPPGCTNFLSDIGIDDMNGENGNAEFRVYLNNAAAHYSGAISGNTPLRTINLSLGSATTMKLQLDPLGTITRDAGNWGNARFQCENNTRSVIEGDINNDGTVNIIDINAIVAHFGKTSGYPTGINLAGTNNIDIYDIMIIIRNWGRTN